MAHSLPPELWHKIISSSSSPRHTASTLSLTSRTLMHLTPPLLFSSLTIDLSNPFRAFHRLRSLLEPSYDGLQFERPIWGAQNPLGSVRSFELRDCQEGSAAVAGGEEGWMRFDMYKAPVDEDEDGDAGVRGLFGSTSTSASTSTPTQSKHDTDHSSLYADRRTFVLTYALSNLTRTLIQFPALQSLTLAFALEPISYATLDSAFKGWLYGRLVYGKLQKVSLRGIRDIELELSTALLGAEEVVIADCTFSAGGMDTRNKRDALNLAMYRGIARSRSRIQTLRFESPHSIDASMRKRRSTLAKHWEFIGINRSIASTVHTLDVSVTSYNPRSLSSAASLVQLLSSALPSAKKFSLHSLRIDTSPLHLSHLSFQPPPDPCLPTSRVLFFPSGSQMLTGHGTEENDGLCWLNKAEFNMQSVRSRDWRDATLIAKQWAGLGHVSPHTSPNPNSRSGSRREVMRRELCGGVDVDEDFSSQEMWFQRYMRDAGFLPPSSACVLSGNAASSSLLSPTPLPTPAFHFPSLPSLSFHISFWLNAPSASSNGEFGFILSYLSALSRDSEAAGALEEVNLIVKVGAGDCVDNFKIWSGSPAFWCPSHFPYPSFLSSHLSPHHSANSPLLQSPTFYALGHTLSSPAFTHLARVKIVLESRIGCQWGIEGVRGVVEGVCGGVRGTVERGMREGIIGDGGGMGADVDVGFRLI